MSVARSVSEVLSEHVTLEIEGIDRLYLNLYVPILQRPEGVGHFWIRHRGHRFASSSLMAPMTAAFVKAIEQFAHEENIDVVCFKKGQRKDEVAKEYLARFPDAEGVLFIGKAQEKVKVVRTQRRRNPRTGQSYPWLIPSTAMVNQYYFYCVDRDFGPFFLKLCSYFPYNGKVCLNGHEYLKRQLAREGIAYEALDNGLLSCAVPERAQQICDELTAGKIQVLVRKWLRRLPHPFTAEDRLSGYVHDISILQAEFSLTQVLDRPLTGRVFFEQVIRDNLDLGRPDRVSLVFDRRVTRRTPGRFRARVITEGVIPTLYIDYKRTRVKQYHKEGRALRTETTINETRDFEIGKRLKNLTALREVGFQANRRLLDVQRISHDCYLGEELFRDIHRPKLVGNQRAPALRYGDQRVLALLAVLVMFRYSEQLDEVLEELSSRWRESDIDLLEKAARLYRLGSLESERDNFIVAEEYFARALSIQQKLVPNSMHVARSYSSIGSLARQRNDLETAGLYQEKALQIMEKVSPLSSEVASGLESLGLIAELRGALSSSRYFYESALEILNNIAPFSLKVASNLHKQASLAIRQGEQSVAMELYSRAIEVLEVQLGKLGGSPHTRSSFLAQHGQIYRDAVGAFIEGGREFEAWMAFEAYRGKYFRAMLAERELVFSADIGREVDLARRRIEEEYNRTQWELATLSVSQDKDRIRKLSNKLVSLREERERLFEKIRKKSPRLAELQAPQPIDIRGIEEALDQGTLLLAYNVRSDATDLFVVSSDGGLRTELLPVGSEDLRRLVGGLVEQLLLTAREEEAITGFVKGGRELFDILVSPVAESVDKSQRVLLIPDHPLHALPWGALVLDFEGSREASARSWQYLAEWKPLHIGLSASVYAGLKEGRELARKADGEGPRLSWVGFGDPAYPTNPSLRRARTPGGWWPTARLACRSQTSARAFGLGA